MPKSNFERMIELADEVFNTRQDPNQLDVNEEVIAQLQALNPATLSEYDDGNGPVVWILLIPTTQGLMSRFLEGDITEKELLDLTSADAEFEAIYLCSALVLAEYRRKGIAKRLTLEAIEKIRRTNPIKWLFVWTFSKEGELGADAVAKETGLKLFKRK
jgi:ribosomal protein S18 acetylase RimI-like enzyme